MLSNKGGVLKVRFVRKFRSWDRSDLSRQFQILVLQAS